MAAIDINWSPTSKQLRQFGVICLVALPILTWVFVGHPDLSTLLTSKGLPVWVAFSIGAVLSAAGIFRPRILGSLFVALSIITYPIGLIISEAIIFLIYVLLFIPVSVFFKVIRRDGLERIIDREASTYWKKKGQPAGIESYFRQS